MPIEPGEEPVASLTIFSSTAVALSPRLTTVSRCGVQTQLSPSPSLAALSSTLRSDLSSGQARPETKLNLRLNFTLNN